MDRLLGKSSLPTSMIGNRLTGLFSVCSPGRWHASVVMKLVIAHIVMGYEIRLEDEKARTLWRWETFIMPYESTRFLLKERKS
jgi:hypothetical protein